MSDPYAWIISIHAPRAGSDPQARPAPRPPSREFQSTLPVRGATDTQQRSRIQGITISIHAPRAGSDSIPIEPKTVNQNFNPRSPCGERLYRDLLSEAEQAFQSTLPVRGATFRSGNFLATFFYFNPRSPCGERRLWLHNLPVLRGFQSTLPVRGATVDAEGQPLIWEISIHAPRAGSDAYRQAPTYPAGYFNPRSPCGERLKASRELKRLRKFQSTLPVRGATLPAWPLSQGRRNFNPRSPCGERPPGGEIYCGAADRFQSTLPVRGATQHQSSRQSATKDFNPRSPCGERRVKGHKKIIGKYNFNPRSPCGERPHCRSFSELLKNHFNPRSPCGERRDNPVEVGRVVGISIHAPRAGSDLAPTLPCAPLTFQSTLPVRGATTLWDDTEGGWHISIHAPRAGSD